MLCCNHREKEARRGIDIPTTPAGVGTERGVRRTGKRRKWRSRPQTAAAMAVSPLQMSTQFPSA